MNENDLMGGLNRVIQDTTQWDLMDAAELECRIWVYQASKDECDLFKVLSCLRLISIYFLRTRGKNSKPYIDEKNKNYYPLFTSPRIH